MAVSPERPIDLAARAARVLRDNDLGGWTKASPCLYPHQWSWDSAFIAIGWARLDPVRAAAELRSLFARQWANGMVPHIVFNPAIPPGSYFPGPERWATADLSDPAPSGPPFTSGLCQPPVHAIAAYRIWLVAHEGDEPDRTEIASFLREIYPRLLAWHRYLATARDPERSGLVTIYHPWEGTDNSPRWDDALAAIEVGEVETYARTDLALVADQSQRPTKAEYDRYLWLVDALKRARYDDASIQRTHPFQIKDVLFSAIAVAANVALLAIAGIVGAADQERAIIAGWIERGRRGLDEQWDERLGLALDHDLRRAAPIATRTVAGFAPLIAGGLSPARMAALLKSFDSEAFCGHPDLRWPVPPSTSPLDSGFRARSYWRGPTWPVMNWLLWWALEERGEKARAAALRRASLDQLTSVGFAEYVEPFTGEPLGSADQSWTAAVALDWLANEEVKLVSEQSMTPSDIDLALGRRAAEVLRLNDLGDWTKASPRLYPHQWSWDSAFIAIGLARLDSRRAMREMTTLFAAQWHNGMVPHIVFNPEVPAGHYFPDAARWAPPELLDEWMTPPQTSGICQPPVHALAVRAAWEAAQREGGAARDEVEAAVREIAPKLLAWHRFLATDRDPDGSGLVTIYHPWESGADNSPRWDAAMAAVRVGNLPPYTRHDLQHVADPSQRPTNEEYDRYLWLVEELKHVFYDEVASARAHPFRVKDVLFSAILVAANRALLDLADVGGIAGAERAEIEGWIERGRRGLDERWDDEIGLYLDYDLVAGAPIPIRTVAGFAGFVAGGLTPERQAALLGAFDSTEFCGHPEVRWPLPPSTSPGEAGFNARSYWRGPTWPFMHLLFWLSLREIGEAERAEALRQVSLAQIASAGFAEYIEPFTGEPLGSGDQSWTAAAVIEWLAAASEGTTA